MIDRTLAGCRILVVEDEYMLADDLATELRDAGATVLGPVGTVADALALIQAEERVHGVILDVSLRGEMVFPAADLLIERGVPFLFTTGYDAATVPPRFAHVPRFGKPTNIRLITQAIGRVIHG